MLRFKEYLEEAYTFFPKSEDDIRQLNTDRLNEQLLLHSFKNLKYI